MVAQAWRDEFAAVSSVGGLFVPTIHPRGDFGSGRSVRMKSVEALLHAIAECDDIWLATCSEVAAHALAQLNDDPLPA